MDQACRVDSARSRIDTLDLAFDTLQLYASHYFHPTLETLDDSGARIKSPQKSEETGQAVHNAPLSYSPIAVSMVSTKPAITAAR